MPTTNAYHKKRKTKEKKQKKYTVEELSDVRIYFFIIFS